MLLVSVLQRSVSIGLPTHGLLVSRVSYIRPLGLFHLRNPLNSNNRQGDGFISQRFISNPRRKSLRNALRDRSEHFWKTEQKIRKRSKMILSDFEQKYKLKERMEKIIERENILTLPNILCVSRIIASPYLGFLIVNGNFNTAFFIMIIAGVTDLLDGFIARNYESQSSKLGSFLDPLADKILISTMFVTMTYVELVPLYLTSLIITRDIALAAFGFYIRYISLPPPKTLARYLDLTHATAQLKPLFISKINTLLQLATAGISLTSPVLGFTDHPGLVFLWVLTASTTALTAVCYLVSKDTYKFLRKVRGR